MYCSECGAQISDTAKFCPECGTATSGGSPRNISSTISRREITLKIGNDVNLPPKEFFIRSALIIIAAWWGYHIVMDWKDWTAGAEAWKLIPMPYLRDSLVSIQHQLMINTWFDGLLLLVGIAWNKLIPSSFPEINIFYNATVVAVYSAVVFALIFMLTPSI